MQREIGSEFWEIPIKENPLQLFDNNKFFRSGRDALRFIISDIKKSRSVGSVALPSWCCDSIILPFVDEGILVEFYSYNSQDSLEKVNADVLVVMDFFGFKGLEVPSNYQGITIRDLTHTSLLRNYSDTDYSFGSLRKWVGINTGGYASKKDRWLAATTLLQHDEYSQARTMAMKEKKDYINGLINSKSFLDKFATAEAMLEDGSIYGADSKDIENMKCLDVEFVANKRRTNSAFLIERLSKVSLFNEIQDEDCPLFIPIVVSEKDRDLLRRYLISKDIYCPIHWPLTKYHNVTNEQRQIYNTEISIVCDQRYCLDDMSRICDEIEYYFK